MPETYAVYTQHAALGGYPNAPKRREINRIDAPTALRCAAHCARHHMVDRVFIVCEQDDMIGIDWRRATGLMFPEHHQMSPQVWAMFPQGDK